MPTATKTQATHGTFYARKNSRQEWKLVETDELALYQHLGYRVKYQYSVDGKLYESYLGKEREASRSQKAPNYDEKIGSVPVIHAKDYTIKYGARRSTPNKKTMTVKGSELYATLRELLAKKNRGFLVNDVPIAPADLGEPKTISGARKVASGSDVDPIVNATNEERSVTVGKLRIAHYFDKDFTWFQIYAGDQLLEGYEQVNAYIPDFRESFKDTLDYHVYWSDNPKTHRKAFYVKFAHIALQDIKAFVQLKTQGIDLGDSTKEQAIVQKPVKFNGQEGNVIAVICDEYGYVTGFAHPAAKSAPLQAPAPKQQKPPKLRKGSRTNNTVTKEAFRQAFHEDRDGGKYMGHMSRENGRFGSSPLYDDHSDESFPD